LSSPAGVVGIRAEDKAQHANCDLRSHVKVERLRASPLELWTVHSDQTGQNGQNGHVQEATVEATHMGFTQAKSGLSGLFDELEHGRGARVVERRKSPAVALVGRDELLELLREWAPFSTKMSRAEDGTVSVWLNELDIYGRGASIAEAVDDLLDEVEDYVEDWEATLHDAPNHKGRAWWVRRVQLAQDRNELRQMLFPAPAVPA
jgi:hypothetical protein